MSGLALLSTPSNIGVLPALSAISMAEYTSIPYSIRTYKTSKCDFSIAWWSTVAPELSCLRGEAPFSRRYLTNSWYPPLAEYINGVHPFGDASSMFAPPYIKLTSKVYSFNKQLRKFYISFDCSTIQWSQTSMIFKIHFNRFRSMTSYGWVNDELCQIKMTMDAAYQKRSLAMLILHIYIYSASNKELRNLFSVIFACEMKWCGKLCIDKIWLSTSSF